MPGHRLPKYFRASASHGRGYPRFEKAVPRGLMPPTGSDEKLLAAFRANSRLLETAQAIKVTLEKKGSRWPDFIGCSQYGKGVLASEQVCDVLTREGISGWKAIPVEFAQPCPARLDPTNAPRYFALKPVIEVGLRVCVFQEAGTGFEFVGNYDLANERPGIPKDGKGICKYLMPEGLDPSEKVVFGAVPEGFGCDLEVASLAFREKWTNLQLAPFDAPWSPSDPRLFRRQLSCENGSFDGPWYSETQESLLNIEPPAPETRGLWGRMFRRR